MTDKLQALVAHDNAQKALIASQAAEVARLEALVVSRVRASADAVVEIATQAAEIAALRKALATIAFQSTDMPGAAVGAGDGFYRGYVFDMIGTAARALSGDTDHDHR